MPTPMKLVAAGLTDVGRARDGNEDSFRIAEDDGLFVVCDGMGGHASGEVASQIAADEIVKFITETRKTLVRPVSSASNLTPEEVALVEAISSANEKVFFHALHNKDCAGMGTTVVVLLEAGENVVLAHVGDSRIYRLRDGIFSQVTEDHSLLNHLIQTQGL
ncbi:MAG: serine/threonine-protein phosphatase, partial [Deltaproteobacteria bacterium]|nr:serine/threonine-protein phosphatase [Deltaproteobacteria bacterium]